MDPLIPSASALAIKDRHIAWIGDQKNSADWIGKNTQCIDLKGAFVYPGFIDTHAHILYAGITKTYLQLHECRDKQAILKKVEECVKKTSQDEWIIGVGWNDHHWLEKRDISAADLNAVAPNQPVVLQRIDTHLLWVNSCVLERAGIDDHTPNPAGGIIGRDSQGHANGILIDTAMLFVKKIIPAKSFQDNVGIVKAVLQECLQKVIKTIHNAATDEADFEIFKDLAVKGALKVRLYPMASVKDAQGNCFLHNGPQAYGDFLQLRCLKMWMDGALGSSGAALFEPYCNDCENSGLLLWTEEDLLSILKQAKSKGFQVAMHAIGDRANHFVLNAYEKIDVKSLRWRIEHAQLLNPDDIQRFAGLKVIAAMQPLHATTDMFWLEDRIGTKRIEAGAFVWRALLDQGTKIVGGSDAPVVDFNPLWGIHAAITRQNHHQFPEKGWYPKQRMTREEALKIYTINAAYAGFAEKDLGSLTPGKLADRVILPENLLLCSPQALLNMQVIYTIVNGAIVYTR